MCSSVVTSSSGKSLRRSMSRNTRIVRKSEWNRKIKSGDKIGCEISLGQKSCFGDRHRKSETNGHLAASTKLKVIVLREHTFMWPQHVVAVHVCIWFHEHTGRRRASWTCWKSFMNMLKQLHKHSGRASWPCWKRFMNMLEELHKHSGKASWTCWKSFTNILEELHKHAGRASWTCWKSFTNILEELHEHAGRASQTFWKSFMNMLQEIERKQLQRH